MGKRAGVIVVRVAVAVLSAGLRIFRLTKESLRLSLLQSAPY